MILFCNDSSQNWSSKYDINSLIELSFLFYFFGYFVFLFNVLHDSEKWTSVARRSSVRRGVLRNFAKFTGKHLRQILFFNKVAKKRFWHRCFPLNFTKLLWTLFLQNTSRRLHHCSIILFNRQDQGSWVRVSKNSKSCKKWA